MTMPTGGPAPNPPQPGAPGDPYPPVAPYPPAAPYPPPGPPGYYPDPSQQGYMPPPTRRNRRGLVALVIIVLLVGGIGGGIWLFRDRLSGSVTELQVGDCIDSPSQANSISEVQHQPCTDPHDGEVIAVLVHPAAADEPYPVVSGFDDYIQAICVPAFDAYTGRDFNTDTELGLSYFHPTLSGWSSGDRGFSCYLSRVDGQKITGSMRASGATSSP